MDVYRVYLTYNTVDILADTCSQTSGTSLSFYVTSDGFKQCIASFNLSHAVGYVKLSHLKQESTKK